MQESPYRILHIFANMGCGGAETRTMELYRHIDRSKVQFDFMVFYKSEHYYDEEIQELGGRIFRVRHPRNTIIGHLLDMYKIMKSEGPFQAVHSHTSFHSGLSLFVAKIANIKFRICHARTTSTKNANSLLKKIQFFIGRGLILSCSTSKIAISESSGEYIFGKRALKSGEVKILPNAINLIPYRDLNKNTTIKIRKSFGISEQTLVIGHVGRFNFMKNHKFLIKIAENLSHKGIDYRIVLVGDGDMKYEIENLVNEKNLSHNILFLGIRNDVYKLMKFFNVLIMPSLFEGLGGVVIEAQAAGTPCVVSNKLPFEVDMGLNLVEFLDLSCSIDKWVETIIKTSQQKRLDFDFIYSAFLQRGFTLECAEEKIMETYGIKSIMLYQN